ncbi:MAG: hypothetical protein M1814_004597 [Vezdaea aestivalis]|nr:MAG: hypothetical protein M1814_004597 [Vezdaea aestivalis]
MPIVIKRTFSRRTKFVRASAKVIPRQHSKDSSQSGTPRINPEPVPLGHQEDSGLEDIEDPDDTVVRNKGCSKAILKHRFTMDQHPLIPDYALRLPLIKDLLDTQTSGAQDEAALQALTWLEGAAPGQGPANRYGIQALERQDHVSYLRARLQKLPGAAVFADASRPWLVYWALVGLSMLGDDISGYRERVIETFTPLQNVSGGFGGGHGHLSHCAATYAAVLSLVTVGGAEALEIVNRKAMWNWISQLKQSDGGFTLSVNGEEDVRGAYCVLSIVAILGLPLELAAGSDAKVSGLTSLTDGLPEYISRCQTYEGGISGSPGSEAHGGYAFCALAALSILGEPHKTIPKYMDLPSLIRWLSARQYAPEGGFSGRSNKLADGCYSWWIGGCWPIIEAALNGPTLSSVHPSWKPPVGNLFDRQGLIRYILSCCQEPGGGLRDKPSKNPDGYHTCYILAGLSMTQYTYHYSTINFVESLEQHRGATSHPLSELIAEIENKADSATSSHISSAFSWVGHRKLKSEASLQIYGDEDIVKMIHPIFVVPWGKAEKARVWFQNLEKF